MNQTVFGKLSQPVKKLFSLGEDAARGTQWPNYLDYGITSEHIPDLLLILRNIQSLWFSDPYDEEQGSTPIHAWRALGQLQAIEAINTLIFLAHEDEEYNSDWIGEEIPVVMGMIGPGSIPILNAYLTSPERKLWATVTVAHSLEKIGNQHPESRAECVGLLQHALEGFLENDETLNAFLISFLVDLKAVEAVPLVEEAYLSGNVDIFVLGDFEDFQIEMGLLEKRLTPPPRYQWMKNLGPEREAAKGSQREFEQYEHQLAQKEKKKGKQAKKTRRGRRRKRK